MYNKEAHFRYTLRIISDFVILFYSIALQSPDPTYRPTRPIVTDIVYVCVWAREREWESSGY